MHFLFQDLSLRVRLDQVGIFRRYEMTFRSKLSALVLTLFSLCVLGCGSSTESFVATGGDGGALATSNLTFNFVTAQAAFPVDAGTVRLRFEFFENAGALGEPLIRQTLPFESTVTISNVPVSVQSFRITSLGAGNVPLATITQDIVLTGGGDKIVTPVAQPVAVFLLDAFFVPTNVAGSESALDVVELPVGGTGQVFLLAAFSNGDLVPLGNLATYSLDGSDPDASNILEVGEFGQLRGLSEGETTLVAQYAGQTFTIQVIVGGTTSNLPDDGGNGNGGGITGTAIISCERNGGFVYRKDIFAFAPTAESDQLQTTFDILSPSGFPTLDTTNNRVIWPSSFGLNIMDAQTLGHVLGSPIQTGVAGDDIGTIDPDFPRLNAMAFDPNRNRVYGVGSNGLVVFEAATMSQVPGSPFPVITNNTGAFAVAYDNERGLIWITTTEQSGVSGDNGVITAFDADTLTRVTGLPDGDGEYINLQTNSVKGQMVFDSTNDRVYVGGDTVFSAVDCVDRTLVEGSPFNRPGGRDTSVGAGLLYVPSQNRLYLANFQDNNVDILDATSLEAVEGSPVATLGNSPAGLAFDPGTNRLFVTHFNVGGISFIDTNTNTLITGSPFFKGGPDGNQAYEFGILTRP